MTQIHIQAVPKFELTQMCVAITLTNKHSPLLQKSFPCGPTAQIVPRQPIFYVSMSHTIRHTPGRTPLYEGSDLRRGYYLHNTPTTTTQQTNIHALSGNSNPWSQEKSGRRLRFRLHWHRASEIGYSHLETTLEWQAVCSVSAGWSGKQSVQCLNKMKWQTFATHTAFGWNLTQ